MARNLEKKELKIKREESEYSSTVSKEGTVLIIFELQ